MSSSTNRSIKIIETRLREARIAKDLELLAKLDSIDRESPTRYTVFYQLKVIRRPLPEWYRHKIECLISKHKVVSNHEHTVGMDRKAPSPDHGGDPSPDVPGSIPPLSRGGEKEPGEPVPVSQSEGA